jgi:hypothetical protein
MNEDLAKQLLGDDKRRPLVERSRQNANAPNASNGSNDTNVSNVSNGAIG